MRARMVAAGTGQAGAEARDGHGMHSGWRDWARWATLALAGLAVVALIVSVVRGREWAAGEHQRNYRALDLVGRTIDGWPGAVDHMARSALIPSRLERPPDARRREAGWAAAARFRHPEIGDMTVLYRRAGKDCANAEARTVSLGRPRGMLEVAGHLDLRDIWIEDQYSKGASGEVELPTGGDVDALLKALAPQRPGQLTIDWAAGGASDKGGAGGSAASAGGQAKVLATDKVRCDLLQYQAQLPLNRVASPTVIASDLRAALLLDRDGRVIVALGDDVGAVRGWDDVAPDSDEYRQTLRTLMAAAAAAQRGAPVTAGQTGAADTPAQTREKALASIGTGRPFAAYVGGRRYLVYLRPMTFSGGWRAAVCDPPAVQQGEQAPSAATGGCMLVGLAAQDDVRQRALSLSSALLILLALALAIALALAPAFKLRFLGAGGDMSSIERRLVWTGLVGATGLATAAVLFVLATLVQHGQAQKRLEAVSEQLATQFRAELRAALGATPPMGRLFANQEVRGKAGIDAVEPRRWDGRQCDIDRGVAGTQLAADVFISVPRTPAGSGAYGWPVVESWHPMGELGFAHPGTRVVASRCFLGGRASASGRHYFRRAMAGDFDGALPSMPVAAPREQWSNKSSDEYRQVKLNGGFAVDAVRTRPEGVTKLVVAIPFEVTGSPPPRPDRGALLAVMTPRSLLAPVLPKGVGFLVVDASQPDLPYRFGDHPQRIDVQKMVDAFSGPAGVRAIEQASREGSTAVSGASWAERLPGSVAFVARIDGERHRFVARRLPGTSMVLLVHQPTEALNARTAMTTLFAIYAWMGLLLAAFGLAVAWKAFGWSGRGGRSQSVGWLWPWPGDAGPARNATRVVLFAGAVAAAGLVAAWFLRLPTLAALMAVVAPVVALALGARALRRARPDQPTGRLLPADERSHRRLGVALLAVLGVIPMAGVWIDSALVSRAAFDAANAHHLAGAFETNRAATAASLRSMGLDRALPPPAPRAQDKPTEAQLALDWSGLPGIDPASRPAPPRRWGGLSAALRDWAGVDDDLAARRCDPGAKGWFCIDPATGEAGLGHQPGGGWSLRPDQLPALVALLMGAAGAATALLYLLKRSQIALFGFGVPLNATDYPRIERNPPQDSGQRGMLRLPALVVALNGPRALELELREGRPALDLAFAGRRVEGGVEPPVATFVAMLEQDQAVVVTGLDVALRDAKLRHRALRTLEALVAARAKADTGRIVIVTDLSPLDRILQAFERELHEAMGSDGGDRDARQEQLRWSRLFEPFATISLPVVPKFHWTLELSDGEKKALEREGFIESTCEGILLLVKEVRLLPAAVIDSLIEPESKQDSNRWNAASADGYPLDEGELHKLYGAKVFRWARAVRPATEKAAVDYLRGMLIEHYQHLWAASSHAERIVLDHLARGRTVNLKAALAMRSLVRRGLVVLDPAPRLMNRSFGAFVKQAERPETVAAYRRQLGRSGWEKAARPFALLGGLGMAALAGLAALAGESLTTMLPFVFGAAPALVAALSGVRRAG